MWEKYVKVSISLVKANIQISIEYSNVMMVDKIVTFLKIWRLRKKLQIILKIISLKILLVDRQGKMWHHKQKKKVRKKNIGIH